MLSFIYSTNQFKNLFAEESPYLELKHDFESKSYTIVINSKKTIPEEDLKGRTSFSLMVSANLAEKIDRAIVIFYLPTSSLKFTSTLYKASYDAEKKTVTVGKTPIQFTNSVQGLTITVDDSKWLLLLF